MKHRTGIALMVIGLLMILSSAGLIAINYTEELESTEAAFEAEEAVAEKIDQNLQQAEPAPLLLPPHAVPKTLAAEELDGKSYIGTLGLPVLGLDLPIPETWSYAPPRSAPCRQFGTTAQNLVIAGHKYRSRFGKLGHLLPGDPVTFTDMDGAQTAYEVGTVETILPADLEKVQDPQWDLVLYTCTYGRNARITVGCLVIPA